MSSQQGPIVHPPIPRVAKQQRPPMEEEHRFLTYLLSAIVFMVVCSVGLVAFITIHDAHDAHDAPVVTAPKT